MKYFKSEEFECKCGCKSNDMQPVTLAKLEMARALAGVPFVITSGYRCEVHNKAVGGKSESAHTKGYAVDIKAVGSSERYSIVFALMSVGFTRLGFSKTFIHVDNDPSLPQKVIWDY